MNFKIIEIPQNLKNKVKVRKGKTIDQLVRSGDQAVEDYKEAYLDQVKSNIEEMYKISKMLDEKDAGKTNDTIIERISSITYELESLAGTYENQFGSELASLFCKFLNHRKEVEKHFIKSVLVYVDSLVVSFSNDSLNDDIKSTLKDNIINMNKKNIGRRFE